MQAADVLNTVYDRLQLSSSPPAAVTTRLVRFLNRWHRKVLSPAIMLPLRKTQVTFASVADTFAYGINLDRITTITERDNDRRLEKRTESWWKREHPDPTAFTGTPDAWVNLDIGRRTQPPANASELYVISGSASDTQAIRIEAIRSTGHRVSLTATMNGTTAVQVDSGTTDIIDLVGVVLASAAAGDITVREDSGTGTVLATIPKGRVVPTTLRFALAPTPSAAITYYVDGTASLADISDSTDALYVPDDFQDILDDGVTHDEWLAHGRLKDAQQLRDQIDRRVLELKHWVWMQHHQGGPGDGHDHFDERTFEETISLPIS